MTLEHLIMIALFGLGICGLCYLWSTAPARELGEKMLEEFETRRERLKLEQPALLLAQEHINYLAWERRLADAPPPVRPPPTRSNPRTQLRLVRSGQPIKCERFDPDDAA